MSAAQTTRSGRVDQHGRPVDRYGGPRPWVRPVVLGVTVLLGAAATAWVLWAGLYHAQPDVAGRLRGFEVLDDGTVSATIDVERNAGTAAVCLLEAQASDHFVVGERQVRIPAGPEESLSRTYRIRTERRATTAVLDGCTAAGVSRPGNG